MTEFNAKSELDALRTSAKIIRKKRYYTSTLDSYKGELIVLRHRGGSIAELQRFLRSKRIHVAWSTVNRWMQKHG